MEYYIAVRRMEKLIIKKLVPATNRAESRGHSVDRKKTDAKVYTLSNSVYTKFKSRQN